MTPEPNRPDEREAADVLAALSANLGCINGAGLLTHVEQAALSRAIALLRRDAPREGASVPQFTTGHCENKRKPGGCPLHNLQCGYPKCDQRPVPECKPNPLAFKISGLSRIARAALGIPPSDSLGHIPPPADAPQGAMTDNSRAGSVTVPRCDLLALLEGNLAAANIALSIHPLIDRIEENGGADAEDDSEQMAYHLYYTLAAAARLRDIAEKPE